MSSGASYGGGGGSYEVVSGHDPLPGSGAYAFIPTSYSAVAASPDGTWAVGAYGYLPWLDVSLQQADPEAVKQEIADASKSSGAPYFTDGSTVVGAIAAGTATLLDSHTLSVYGPVGIVDGNTSQAIVVADNAFTIVTQDPATGKITVKAQSFSE